MKMIIEGVMDGNLPWGLVFIGVFIAIVVEIIGIPVLPFAIGACEALGGNVMTDAFGIVAMVAMTPLITIQGMGFLTQMKEKAAQKFIQVQLDQLEDDILYFN